MLVELANKKDIIKLNVTFLGLIHVHPSKR
jgi:hypothetical protein